MQLSMKGLKEETEQKIIKAAHEIFIEKGLEGARMQEIADRAGINKALLHYYFRSKDKLFDAVFQEIIMQIIPKFSQKLSEGLTLMELIESFIGFYNEIFRQNPYLPQFFFHEIWQHPDKLAAFIKSQNFNPKEIIEKNKDKLPQVDSSGFFMQHMIANVLGMTLFPHIGRPLFQRLFFDNNNETYDEFLSERTSFLIKMMEGFDQNIEKNLNNNPLEDF